MLNPAAQYPSVPKNPVPKPCRRSQARPIRDPKPLQIATNSPDSQIRKGAKWNRMKHLFLADRLPSTRDTSLALTLILSPC